MLIITTGKRTTTHIKETIKTQIQEIYHEHHGVTGYRSMTAYLSRKGYHCSPATVHKYMNIELGLHSIVRPKKPAYRHGKPHQVFDNKLGQDFTADRVNQKSTILPACSMWWTTSPYR